MLAGLASACGGASDSQFGEGNGGGGAGATSNACEAIHWREASAGRVACPGSADCVCGASATCCLDAQSNTQFSATCGDLTACKAYAFQCDGPEDCGEGLLCCARLDAGGGSSCKKSDECFAAQQVVMCHADEDCASAVGTHCTPAEPGSIFDGTVASCAL